MRCINCSEDLWSNVDQFRLKPSGMSICKSCGFVSYPAKWKTEDEIKAHYREDYRNPPNSGNYFTGQRKIHFHNAFLQDMFKEWITTKKEKPQVFEIGAAYGLALAWLRGVYPGTEVSGSELTTSYRRNAFHEFKIKLEEDFDKSRKYDLIMSYKVAEHQMDADKRLREYSECLNEGGYLYISVPTWFDSACNFGLPGFDLEYYYEPNHINVWTREIFENILQRAGFEIVKKDTLMYDSTYLCKVNLTNRDLPILKENFEEVKIKMDKIKKAFLLVSDGDAQGAIDLWPDYPQAWATLIESTRRQLFEKGWGYIENEFIPKLLESCNNTGVVWGMITDLAMRGKRWGDAIQYAEQGLEANPENPSIYQQLMNIMREMALQSKEEKEKLHYWEQARNVARHGIKISAQHFKEFTDHSLLFNSQLPIPKDVDNEKVVEFKQ